MDERQTEIQDKSGCRYAPYGKSLTHSSETDLPNCPAECRQIWQIYFRYRLTKLYKKTTNRFLFFKTVFV